MDKNECSTKGSTQVLTKTTIQSNLDYPDLLGLDEIVWIIKGADNQEYEY